MSADGPVPRYVLPSAEQAATVLRRLERQGWRLREGFALPESRWDVAELRLVLHDRVADVDTVELVVHAAVRGAGVVAVVDPRGELGRAVLADLARIGPVRGGGDDDAAGPAGALDDDQRRLLARLAAGETIAAAAAAEFLSLRTANRRIAQARQAIGVRTTREAVLAYARLTRGS
jgi:hypothetical protein